ncbi:MAG: hypothetical protein RSF70_08415 [Ruthenibacterium sp.]
MKIQWNTLNMGAKISLNLLANMAIAFAMGLMHYSDVGADPITVLIGGIANAFSISAGAAATCLSILFFSFSFLFNRTQIKGATILSVFTLGPFMNLSLYLIRNVIPGNLPFWMRVIESSIGACIMGLAIGFYLSLDFGASPTDSVMLWFHKVLHLNYQYCTWIFYAISLFVGVLLGGVFGVGTILSLLLVGTCINWMHKKLQ